MIQIEHVSFQYANAKEPALRDVSLTIQKGEFVVLLGSSGCGKTTITRLINRLVPEFFEGELEGRVFVDGQNTDELSIQDLAGVVGSVFQDPRSQFFATDTTAEIAFSCENAGIPREEICRRIEQAANDLQIQRLLERSIFELSSGEKQSIAIASVYALAPKILVLDEPSANLDAAATEHLMEILHTVAEKLQSIEDAEFIDKDGKDVSINQYDIEFKDVSFGYDSREVLSHISFRIPQNTTTAIVGPSGSGKTTICSLLARFYDAQNGEIQVGGHNVREFTCDSLLKNISMVFQNVYLFHDSIRNNILFGKPDASEEEIIAAAKAARCHDFIMALPDGYNTVVGEGGSTLSGGEKQRISIARAMLKNAPIVILDEATASIDPENEHLIQQAIGNLTHGKTIIVIAHRLATIESADQILVIDEGKVVQRGTHQQLVSQNGLYKRFISIREQAEGWTIG